ncbi:hypothetical protein HYR99_20605 [Candidatus Poribacteria bacterium]|nr:hypothetical protein [Candidatus Poribacteria bacterium]
MTQLGVGKIIRMGQLINAESQHTVIVAIDHGLGGAAPGIENLEPALEKIIAGKPDAIIMSMGVAKRFQHLLSGRGKPSIIITVDRRFGATLPGKSSQGEAYRLTVDVEEALLIGASAVKMVMIYGREDVEVHTDNAEAVAEVARQCDQWREAGADVLKIHYTGDVPTFREVIQTCPIPIVILGGAKMDTERDVLMTASGAMEAGAIGVAFGRNVFQHADPTGMIRALRQVVHEGASVEAALGGWGR